MSDHLTPLAGPCRLNGRPFNDINNCWQEYRARSLTLYPTLVRAGAVGLHGGYFGEGVGLIFLDNLECLGNESSLFDCEHEGIRQSNCFHNEDVSVLCQGKIIRLDILPLTTIGSSVTTYQALIKATSVGSRIMCTRNLIRRCFSRINFWVFGTLIKCFCLLCTFATKYM